MENAINQNFHDYTMENGINQHFQKRHSQDNVVGVKWLLFVNLYDDFSHESLAPLLSTTFSMLQYIQTFGAAAYVPFGE